MRMFPCNREVSNANKINENRSVRTGQGELFFSKPLQLRRPKVTAQHLRATQTESCSAKSADWKPVVRARIASEYDGSGLFGI